MSGMSVLILENHTIMTKQARPFLYAGIVTGVTYLTINLLSMVYAVLLLESKENWSVRFDNGVFYVNENLTGLLWGEPLTVGIMAAVFLVVFFYTRSKQRG